MHQVSMGSDAIAFIDRVLKRLDAMPLTVHEIEFDATLGYPGEGWPPEPTSPSSPSHAATAAPASPSPALIAFITASEARLSAAAASSPPLSLPLPPSHHTVSPPPVPHLSAASPNAAPAPPASPSPRSTAAGLNASPDAAAAALPDAPPPFDSIFSQADPWCASLVPESHVAETAEACHRHFAPSQCAHTAAEQISLPQMLRAASLPFARATFTGDQGATIGPRATNNRWHPTAPSAISHAAHARAQALSAALCEEKEAGGLRMEAGEADWLATRLVQLLEGAAARNTLRGERSNWKHWMAFCVHRNTDPFRKDVRGMDHTQYDKEVLTLALALLFIYGRMGCRAGRKRPPRPASALAVLRGVRRAHDRLGVKMADLSLATRLADSLNREYIDAHGWEALQVDRVAPLTQPIIEGMLAADAVKGDHTGAVAGRALWATMAQTGFRKAEVALSNGEPFRPACLTRHNLRWRLQGRETADPTPTQLRRMKEGDLAIIIPPKSKCDQFGLEWGQAPIYLRFHASTPVCAARALRDLELSLPCHGLQQREGTALFVNGGGQPLTCSQLDALFKRCISQAGLPDDSAARYSPHSFRRYLACALKAQGAADSTIQALLRWKTAESLKLYSFLSDETYADLVDSAAGADVSSVRTNALPRAELLDAAQDFHAARSSLDAAARTADGTSPADDVADSSLETDDGSSDDEIIQQQARPQRQTARRKRTRSSSSASQAQAAAAATPPAPLAASNAVGRHAVVPAHVWPAESCEEYDGAGWEVVIEQVDKRLHAAQIRFVYARNAKRRRFALEWLSLEVLQPL